MYTFIHAINSHFIKAINFCFNYKMFCEIVKEVTGLVGLFTSLLNQIYKYYDTFKYTYCTFRIMMFILMVDAL